MSMVGAQEVLAEDNTGEAWELVGRDMIRNRDSRQIVAQFWTSPSATDARLIAAAPELLEALKALTAACEKLPRISKAMPEAGSPLGLARAALAKAGVA